MTISSLYIGATGMKTHSQGMQVIGNNLANMNTVGFKQSMMLYQDLTSFGVTTGGNNPTVGMSQQGMGASVAEVRVIHQSGGFEPSNTVTDMAISGKGFFQVAQGDKTHYTRAGNFRFDMEGYLVDPGGFRLQAKPIENGTSGALQDLQLIAGDNGNMVLAPNATTSLTLVSNIGVAENKTADTTDPYFSLLKQWDGTAEPPLGEGAFGYSESINVYDAGGNKHSVDVYYDGAPEGANGQRVVEYIMTMPPSDDGGAAAGTTAAGLLMAGTLTFNSSGELIDMTAYTPSGDASQLSNWQPAAFGEGGKPSFTATFAGDGGGAQTITAGFGLNGTGWTGGGSAASVGSNASQLPQLAGLTSESRKTTGYEGSSSSLYRSQDGYAEGGLMSLEIDSKGIMSGNFSNGQVVDLYEIPLFRFTSEFGLRREGGNHFSATKESGEAQEGAATTENFGAVVASTLETSNVDASREFVNMIITQRGFQSQSKVVTTADSMLQKALELKR
ncbi:flagellar hook protein FlgE [Oleidesulfovibrio sp.]|uniref:flagellar hook protein FlgE n=1 Tax=Oleidesulfovibrio sp. TaxID=2909707 RepID=UPI003A8C43CB